MHISIIDDEKILTSKISKKLKLNWYSVSEFYSYNEFMKNWIHDNISDLYIIDLSLWDGSWFNIVNFLRTKKNSNIPIIIISWFWDAQNKVFWLDLWADDYLTKPFSPEELLARIKAILRRPTQIKQTNKILYKDIVIDTISKKVTINGKLIDLTRKENLILEFFIENKWKLIEKEKMIKYIWWVQSSIDVNDNTINATLCKLRKKFWDNFPLKTLVNSWYILE